MDVTAVWSRLFGLCSSLSFFFFLTAKYGDIHSDHRGCLSSLERLAKNLLYNSAILSREKRA